MIKRSGVRCCDSSMIARCNPCPCPNIMTWRTTRLLFPNSIDGRKDFPERNRDSVFHADSSWPKAVFFWLSASFWTGAMSPVTRTAFATRAAPPVSSDSWSLRASSDFASLAFRWSRSCSSLSHGLSHNGHAGPSTSSSPRSMKKRRWSARAAARGPRPAWPDPR